MPRYDSSMTEERVVEMRIDNDNFEKGAKETINTLKKLDQALKIKGDTSAIDDMADSVRKFDASPMAESFDVAVNSISAKATIIDQIIRNLTNSVTDFVKRTVRDVTIEPVAEGMNKYTTLAEVTQSLMAATKDYYAEKGITTEVGQLSELEKILEMVWWYSDETSYEFIEMANTMSKMVAAGVEIEKAAQATVGIATLSAASGADAKAASHTMQYAWTQAFGTGYMALSDFKTLENQNIATKELKENILEIAVECNKLSRVAKDGTDEFNDYYSTIVDPNRYDALGYIQNLTEKEEAAMFNYKNMRESLKDKWFDVEVMTKLTERYGEFSVKLYDLVEASREAGKNITAYEATEMLQAYRENPDTFDWEGYADSVGVSVGRLKELLIALDNVKWKVSETGFYMGQEYKTFKDVISATKDAVSSQWARIFKYIFGNFLEAKKLWSEVGDLFSKVFVSGLERVNVVLNEWHRLGGREFLLGTDDIRGALWNLVDAVSTVVTPIKNAFTEVFGFAKPKQLAKNIYDLTVRFQEWTTELGFSKEAMEGIKNIFTSVFNVANTVLAIFGKGIILVGKLITSVYQPIADFLLRVIGSIIKPINNFIGNTLLRLSEKIDVFDLLGKVIEKAGDAISALLSPSKELKVIFADIKTAIDNLKIGEHVSSAINFIVDKLSKLGINVLPAIEKIGSAFNSLKTFLSPVIKLVDEFKRRLEALKVNEELSPLQRFFYALQGTGHSALLKINEQLEKLGERFPAFKEFIESFKSVSFSEVLSSVKESFVTFGEYVSEWFGPIGEKISGFYNIVKEALINLATSFSELWTKFKEGASFEEVLKDMSEAFKTAGQTFVGWFDPIKQTISEKFEEFLEWLESLKPRLSETWQSVIDFIVTLFGKNSDVITRSETMTLEESGGMFSWLPESIRNALDFILKPIEQIITNFQNALAQLPPIDWNGFINQVLRFGELAVSFASVKAGLSVFKGLKQIGNGFKEFGKSIKEFAKNKTVTKNIEALTKGLADFFGNGANSINSLFDAIKDTLKNGFTIKHKKYDSIGTTILKIAASIAILVGAVYVLTKIPADDVKRALTQLAEIAGGMIILAGAFTALNKFGFDGKPMLRMAISLGIILAAIWVITKLPLDTFYKGLIRVGLILAELAAFSKFSGSKFEFQNAPYIKMAIALGILMIPLKQIAKLDTASLLKGVIGLGSVMAEFAALSKTAMTGVKTGGFIKMAIAVALLSGTMALIAKMDFASMTKGLVGLGGVILEFRAIITASQGLGKVSGFIGMAAAVAILAYVMKQLGQMDLWSAMKGVRMLGFVMTSLGTLINNVKGLTWGSALASLIVIGGMLTEVYFAFKYLNDQNTDFTNVLKFTISIAAVSIGCGFLIKSLANVPFAAGMKALGMFAIFLVGIIALATAISVGLAYVVEKMSPTQLENLKEDLAEASIIMGDIFNVIGSMFGGFISGIWDQTLGKFSLPQLGTDLSEFMTNVQGFITGAQNINTSIGQKIGALSGAILRIAGTEFLTAIANLFSEDGKTVVDHFGTDLVKLGLGMTAFSMSVQSMKPIPGSIPTTVEKMSKAIQTIAGAEFVTALANLFSAENKTVIDYFVTDIAKLGNGLVGFAWSLTGMPENATNDMNNATETAMGLANLANALPTTGGIKKLLGWKDLGDFSKDLPVLGENLKAYSDAIKDIAKDETASAKDRKIAKELANGLANLQNKIPNSHGLKAAIEGWKDLKGFSDDIKELGPALKAYSDSIKGISKEGAADEDDIETAITMAGGLAKLQKQLENTGGLSAEIFGDKSLSDFASGVSGTDGVAGIGAALRTYAESIAGISGLATEEDAKQAIDLAQSLEDFIEGTSQVGGKIQDFTGRWDLANFGTEVATFAVGLRIFTDLAKEVDVEAGSNAITVVQPIKDFIDSLDSEGGIIQAISKFFAGDKLTTLYQQLEAMKTLALDLRTFTEDMANVDADQVGNATVIMDAIGSFLEGIETSNVFEKFVGIFTGENKKLSNLTKTADAMGNFGRQFKDFTSGISGAKAASANISLASQTFDDFQSLILSASSDTNDGDITDLWATMEDMSNFGTQFATFAEGIANAASAVGQFGAAASVIRSFRELQNESAGNAGQSILSQNELLDAVNLGAQIPEALGNGIAQNEAAYTARIDELQANAETVFNGAEMDFYNIGMNLDAGLAAGIYANSAAPINAIAEVCSAMVDTANSMLQVHSPSRLFMQLGDYLDQGLSLGISQNASSPVSSITTLGDKMYLAMQSAMAQVAAITNGSFDFQPQITPVVDMSNVRAGASEYSKLFGGSAYSRMAGGISRNVAAAQNAQAAYNQFLSTAPAANESGEHIQVNVYASEGQSEESVATAVINRISTLSSRRKYAFG